MTTTTTRPASDKTLAFIARLLTERQVPAASREWIEAHPDMSQRHASATIDHLRSLPFAQTDTAKATPGYYVTEAGAYVVVVENKAKTSTYAKRLVLDESGERTTARWEYAPGVGRTLAGMEPMTVAQAAALGHMHGICVKCCKPLTDPKSVQAGIGPVCAKAFA